MEKTKFLIINNDSLVYTIPYHPFQNMGAVLATKSISKRDGDLVFLDHETSIRPATQEDFLHHRISHKGYSDNPEKYEPIACN